MKGLFGLLFLLVSLEAMATKVTLCHVPPGNPENAHTIRVSYHAVLNGHMNDQERLHGQDYFGPCKKQSFGQFYACNIGLRQKNIPDNTTASTHDYVTYSYFEYGKDKEVKNQVLEASEHHFAQTFSDRAAFSRKLSKASFNFSSELLGTEYFIDFCFDGRRYHSSNKQFEIKGIQHITGNQSNVRVRKEVYCDTHVRGNGIADLSRVDLSRGFPLVFNEVPEFCKVRFYVSEEDEGELRNYQRTFNRMAAQIISNADELGDDNDNDEDNDDKALY